MDNDMDDNNTDEGAAAPSRPLGFWLGTLDRLLEHEFDEAFAAEGVTRREWRALTVIAGDVQVPEVARRLHGKKLRGLDERGWVTRTDEGWQLTDEGRAAKERLGAIVDGIRSKVAGAVSEEDYATTVASLEAIARELGWDASQPMPHGRRGFGFGRGRGFGPGFGFGMGPGRRGFGPGFEHGAHHRHGGHGCGHNEADAHGRGHGHGDVHGHGHGDVHGHGHGDVHGRCGHRRRGGHPHHRPTEDAYQRGFEAGFTRGADRRGA